MATKYHNRKTELDGHVFASAAEARRYADLRLLEQAGEIVDLEVHPRFEILPAFRLPIRGKGMTLYRGGRLESATYYVGDFSYREMRHEPFDYIDRTVLVVEDVKGFEGNAVWRLKRRMLLQRYDYIDLRIVHT